MNVNSTEHVRERVATFLGRIRKKGVRVWAEAEHVHYRAPKGILSNGDLELLRLLRAEIISYLGRAKGEWVEGGGEVIHAPFSFSQQARWNLHRLGERRSVRQIASATHLQGRLSIEALEKSIEEVVRRHHALRTRLVCLDGIPMQEISGSSNHTLQLYDLQSAFRQSQACVQEHIEQLVMEPIDAGVGPLFGARLLRLPSDSYVLILAMDHMIADAFSMNVLLRDILTAYSCEVEGKSPAFPALPVQFHEFASWQRNNERVWLEKHGTYWEHRLAGCKRLRFPDDRRECSTEEGGWGTAPIRIGRDQKADLLEWCRENRTTLVLSMFTAYVALVLRVCDTCDAVIQYQSDGRAGHELANSVGYFASVLHLRIQLRDDDDFIALLSRNTEELCRAHQHADFSFIAAQVPRPEFTRNPAFNWVPPDSTTSPTRESGSLEAIGCSPVPFVHPLLRRLELDHEPGMLIYETEEEIVGGVNYPLSRFSANTMELFCRNFLVLVSTMLKDPKKRVTEAALL